MWHRTYYQFYTNVSRRSCPECLALHGLIRSRQERFPERDDGCERAVLAIPRRQLKAYRQKGRDMQAAAQAELRRRDLFRQASDALDGDAETAIDLFRKAATIDLYVPDLEELAETHRERLDRDPELRERLRTMFAKAYSDKFGWSRYERLPELMRLAREKAGIARIHELFS